jgi:hypothetical protein
MSIIVCALAARESVISFLVLSQDSPVIREQSSASALISREEHQDRTAASDVGVSAFA